MTWRFWLIAFVALTATILGCGNAVDDKSLDGKPCPTLGQEKWTTARHYFCEDDGHGNKHWVEQA